MRKIGIVLVVFVALGVAGAKQGGGDVRKRIVGTWKLVSAVQTLEDGTTRPYPQYGPRGRGFLMYAPDGYMCANLLNPDKVKWADTQNPTAAETMAKGESSSAYCGRYEIDLKNQQLVHFPEVSTVPGYEGTRQVRPYRFEGNRLVLTPAVSAGIDLKEEKPRVVRWTIIWEKVK